MKMGVSLWIVLLATVNISLAYQSASAHQPDSEFCTPLVIGHRGASGYVPEHTLGSYALAVFMGADYIEPDLVMTKDGHLVARHDNDLGLTTDIADRPEFASRQKSTNIDGNPLTGWFTEDFTLAELKTLNVIERIPNIRPGNARLDGAFKIVTFQEIIELVKSLEISQRRIIGLYPEIKHSTYFRKLGLPMERAVVDTLHSYGYRANNSPVYIQSFEVKNLIELSGMTKLRLLQLYGEKAEQPFDQVEMGTGLTYGYMSSPAGLKQVAKYAYAVGPDKSYIIPRDANNRLGKPTNFVANAHVAGLKVHPYTFRAENYFLPVEDIRGDGAPTTIGALSEEIQAYLDAGIDGLFSDQPNVPVKLRNCHYPKSVN